MRLPELRGLQVVRSYQSEAEPKTELTQLPRRFTAATATAAAAWRSQTGRSRKYSPLSMSNRTFLSHA